MRKSTRPFVDCLTCKAKIYSSRLLLDYPDGVAREAVVHADWVEPPRTVEKCPRCQADVDTTNAYPSIPSFPPTFEQLKKAYQGFTPKWEHNRKSFDDLVGQFLSEGKTIEDCQTELNTPLKPWCGSNRGCSIGARLGFYRALQTLLGLSDSGQALLSNVGRCDCLLLPFLFHPVVPESNTEQLSEFGKGEGIYLLRWNSGRMHAAKEAAAHFRQEGFS